ncbi:hypothetical protein GCM10010869_71510 [Mesorhizobium tianshanense]|uniref:Uncharacterized protein n=1 Tax=Mesorhizobium tianshanense TaxID=39844 RepID=A0A562P3Z2_9HYPH|nr:hypothetical protein [Mesorhizobium tianshanense]TWI39119.1 hypothetical protein IQ26_01968 [Mesorhizobium tianshanense]GLS41554.1 hypothetical protein GCM10010869_71510 [Mesorhizobium tianshanense]
MPPILAALGCIPLMVLISWAIWRYFKRPTQRWAKAWIGRVIDAVLARFRVTGTQPAE